MSKNLENNMGTSYAESCVEKNNKGIALKIFIVGLVISLILCGVGFLRQNNAKKTNEERAKQALAQSQANVDAAQKRYEEIQAEIVPLKEQYEAKKQEADSMNMSDSNWFANHSRVQREASEINSQISSLESEAWTLQNKDYTVYYSLVKPLTYLLFYYIAGGVFALLSLIALIYFLVTRKK